MSEELEPKRTSRDLNQLDEQLSKWFQGKVLDSSASISDLRRPTGSGMSSETLLFSASWDGGEDNENRHLVARLAPTPEDIPVFPSYDLDLQVQTMKLVRERTSIPTPRVLWLEKNPEILGVPFFIMEQLHGRVPPDIPPYVFGGWLHDAPAEDQQLLEERSVQLIAELSTIDLTTVDIGFLENGFTGDTHLRRHFAAQRDYYQWVVGNSREHPVIEHAFTWLEDNWPEESPTVLSWGDARIGNIMFGENSFSPVAAFDWEMAGLAPVEVDLGWMIFLHKFFQNIAESFEFIGMPYFMEVDNVRRIFTEKTGYIPDDLHWFMVYAGLRHAIIMSRINDRSVRFGQAEWADDVDEAIPHSGLLWTMMEEK